MKLEDIQILKSCFTMTASSNNEFSTNSFQSKSRKFMVEPIDSVY